MSIGRSRRVVAETMETRRMAKELQEKAGSLARGGRSRGLREQLDEIVILLSELSLAEWLSFLEEMRGGNGVVVEELCSIFTFEAFRNTHLVMSWLLKTCLVQYFSSKKICSPRAGPHET